MGIVSGTCCKQISEEHQVNINSINKSYKSKNTLIPFTKNIKIQKINSIKKYLNEEDHNIADHRINYKKKHSTIYDFISNISILGDKVKACFLIDSTWYEESKALTETVILSIIQSLSDVPIPDEKKEILVLIYNKKRNYLSEILCLNFTKKIEITAWLRSQLDYKQSKTEDDQLTQLEITEIFSLNKILSELSPNDSNYIFHFMYNQSSNETCNTENIDEKIRELNIKYELFSKSQESKFRTKIEELIPVDEIIVD